MESTGGASGEIWLVSLQGQPPRRLPGSAPGIFCNDPVFTPDGRSLIYHSNRAGTTNLWMLSINTGDMVRLTTGPGPDYSPTVSRDGSIAFINIREREALILFRPKQIDRVSYSDIPITYGLPRFRRTAGKWHLAGLREMANGTSGVFRLRGARRGA